MINEHAINVKHFFRNIAKNVKTGSILANVAFFVNVFSEKSQKNANYLEKLPKMVKSDFNLANLGFFVKVSSFVGQDRLKLWHIAKRSCPV